MHRVFLLLIPLAYLFSSPTTLPDADSGEFLVLAKLGGIAHPPGYPLYTTLLLGMAKLPLIGQTFIQHLALLSIVLTTVALALLARTMEEAFEDPNAAALGVATIFLSSGVWKVATTIEPFALNILNIAILWRGAWLWLRHPQGWVGPFLVGLAGGIGLCNHHSLLFHVPILFVAAFVLFRRSQLGVALRGVGSWGVLGFVLGSLPLLYFVIADKSAPVVWGEWKSAGDVIAHLTRADYGMLRLSASDNKAGWAMVRMFWFSLPANLSFVFFPIAVVGILFDRRAMWWMGIVSSLSTGVLFFGMFNINGLGASEIIIHRFVHVATLGLLPFVVGGWIWVTERKKVLAPVGALLVVCHLFFQWGIADRSTETFAEQDVRNTFRTVEHIENPVLVAYSDAEYVGALYGKYVLGLEPKGATIVMPALWDAPWYRRRLLDESDYNGPAYLSANLSWEQALNQFRTTRPTYLMRLDKDLISRHGWKSYPEGRLIRLLDDYSPLPTPVWVYLRNTELFAYRFSLPGAYQNLTAWERSLFLQYSASRQAFGSIPIASIESHLAASRAK